MKFDATRRTFDPHKNYSRVLMQQGRVQLDADWNEQSAIQLNYLRQLGADLIGPYGGPPLAGYGANALVINGKQPTPADFVLTTGRYYVDGILCSNETAPAIVTGYPASPGGGNQSIQVFRWTVDGTSFQVGQFIWLFNANPSKGIILPTLLQITVADYPSRTLTVSGDISNYVKAAGDAAPQSHFVRRAPSYLTQLDYPASPLTDGEYQVYLDVWERPITWIEDDSIREAALNGADTAARAKVIAQVKVMPPISDKTCPTSYELAAVLQPANRGCLMARAKPAQASTDPCTISPDALYRGPENQLYRVEIHTGSLDAFGKAAVPTFKWSRENGAVTFPIASGGGTNALVLESLGRDDRFGLAEGDWVEVVDDDYVLQNRALPLMQVQSIDRVRMTVVLSGTPDANVGKFPAKHPLLRRWDQKAGDPAFGGLTLNPSDNAALIFPAQPAQQVTFQKGRVMMNEVGVDRQMLGIAQPSGWLELEDGVQVQFALPPDSDPPAAQFRTGDYWLIPARVATGDVEWPRETVPNATGAAATAAVALPPDGVTHHYAPLARISVAGSIVTREHDCTVTFGPGNGVLGFLEGMLTPDQKLYGINLMETILEAPTQPRAVEMMARRAKPAQTRRATGEPKPPPTPPGKE